MSLKICLEKGLKNAHSYRPCQSAQIAQTNLGQYFSQMHETPPLFQQQGSNKLHNLTNKKIQDLPKIKIITRRKSSLN